MPMTISIVESREKVTDALAVLLHADPEWEAQARAIEGALDYEGMGMGSNQELTTPEQFAMTMIHDNDLLLENSLLMIKMEAGWDPREQATGLDLVMSLLP